MIDAAVFGAAAQIEEIREAAIQLAASFDEGVSDVRRRAAIQNLKRACLEAGEPYSVLSDR